MISKELNNYIFQIKESKESEVFNKLVEFKQKWPDEVWAKFRTLGKYKFISLTELTEKVYEFINEALNFDIIGELTKDDIYLVFQQQKLEAHDIKWIEHKWKEWFGKEKNYWAEKLNRVSEKHAFLIYDFVAFETNTFVVYRDEAEKREIISFGEEEKRAKDNEKKYLEYKKQHKKEMVETTKKIINWVGEGLLIVFAITLVVLLAVK